MALVLGATASAGTEGAIAKRESRPQRVQLTSERVVGRGAPRPPKARALVSISRSRVRRDGRLQARVRVHDVAFPRYGNFFVKITIGNPDHGRRSWVCPDEATCLKATRWIYSRRDLAEMGRYGASIQAYIWTGIIWPAARGEIRVDLLGGS